MLPALALVDAVRAISSGRLRPGVKWVNDVLVDGKKVGGTLVVTQTRSDRVTAVLLGIGLNVAKAPPVPPTPFVPSVGCLVEAGARTTLAETWACVLAALGRRITELVEAGPANLFEAYRDASVVVGREVCVFADPAPGEPGAASWAAPVRGTVRDIGADLSLIIDGLPPVASGRLAFAEDCLRFGL
jgi:biotin-(acetyl-CoA carboxylase) ligase